MALAANGVAVSQHGLERDVLSPANRRCSRTLRDDIVAYQKKDAGKNGPLRGFHAKIHAGFTAEFQVLADLPEHARYGVFAAPRTFPAVVRFSNGESRINADSNHEPRGIAIKLIGALGRKLLPGQEDAVTQDFLATSHSVTSTVRDVRQFIAFRQGKACCPNRVMLARMIFAQWVQARAPAYLESPRPYRPSERGAKHGNRGFLRHGAD